MFAYSGNNPIKYKDVSGQFYVLAAAAIGGVIGAVTGALSTWASGGDGIEILTAAIAGMGAGAISVVSPLAAALIAGYASFEIDVHAQKRLSVDEDVNYVSAGIKGVAAAATGLVTGKLVSVFDVVPSNHYLLSEQFGSGYSMLTYYYDLVNAAIILPIHYAIDRYFSKSQNSSQTTHGVSAPIKNKMPRSAPPNAMYV